MEDDLLAATLEELDGEVFERELFHVKVDKDTLGTRGFKNGHDAAHEVVDAAVGIDRIAPRAQRADFDRDVGAGDRAEVIGLKPGVWLPRFDRGGQVVDKVEVFALIRVGLFIADARLAEQVNAERDSVAPETFQIAERAGGIGSGDELSGHALDLLADGSDEEALGQSAGFDAELDRGGDCHTGLTEVVLKMLELVIGGAQHRKGIDKSEHLHLEVRVLHGPFHEPVAVKLCREHS